MTGIEDALDGLSSRELERIQARIAKRLQSCVIDGNDGAVPVRCQTRGGVFSLLLCPACIERHRLPEGRAEMVA